MASLCVEHRGAQHLTSLLTADLPGRLLRKLTIPDSQTCIDAVSKTSESPLRRCLGYHRKPKHRKIPSNDTRRFGALTSTQIHNPTANFECKRYGKELSRALETHTNGTRRSQSMKRCLPYEPWGEHDFRSTERPPPKNKTYKRGR